MSEKDIPPKTKEKIMELLNLAEYSLLESHKLLIRLAKKKKRKK